MVVKLKSNKQPRGTTCLEAFCTFLVEVKLFKSGYILDLIPKG